MSKYRLKPQNVKPEAVQVSYLTCSYHPQQISVALRCSEQSLGSSGRAHRQVTDLKGEEQSLYNISIPWGLRLR